MSNLNQLHLFNLIFELGVYLILISQTNETEKLPKHELKNVKLNFWITSFLTSYYLH